MTLSVTLTENFSAIEDIEIFLQRNVNSTESDLVVENLALTFYMYYTPVLITLGLIGNLISVIVFSVNVKLKSQSTSQYLTALAISDSLFLCQLLPPWLKTVGASTLFSRNGYCQIIMFVTYTCCQVSSWLVVAFTVERFVAVVYPLRRNSMCSVRRARIIILSLSATSLCINLPVLRFAVTSQNECNVDLLLLSHAARFNLVDTLCSFTVPMGIIIALNLKIKMGLRQSGRVSRTRGHVARQRRRCRQRPLPTAGHTPRNYCLRPQQRVTRMLLIVSTVYVIFNLPAYTMRIVAYANSMDESEYSGKWAALQQICLLLFNTNFGINFGLYCLTGQNFRRALFEVFPWLRWRRFAPNSLRGDTTERPARASSVSTSFAHSFSNNPTEAPANETGNNRASTSASGQAGSEQEGRTGHAAAAAANRQQRCEQVIRRWRFDNSHQQRQGNSFELQQVAREAQLQSDYM